MNQHILSEYAREMKEKYRNYNNNVTDVYLRKKYNLDGKRQSSNCGMLCFSGVYTKNYNNNVQSHLNKANFVQSIRTTTLTHPEWS